MKTGMETLWAQEVIDIMEKYQQGHRAGTRVKNWDEEFKIYRRIDRLGFLHEKELPRVTTQEVKKTKKEIARCHKWLKMFQHWDKYKSSQKMSRRVYKGIPPQVRGRAWSLLLGVDKVKMQNPGKYQRMKEQGKMLCQQIQKIDFEISCTFPNHVMFRDRYDIKQQELFHVLVAFSAYDMEVGYCEGMSHIAAILLMHLNEEDAFWALVQLMTNQRHNMHGFFIPGAPKLRRLLSFHEQLLRTMLPQLQKHLDDQGVIADVYTYWFSQCFIEEIPFHLSLRIFDVYILEGEPVLTGMAYTTMKIHGKFLQKLHQAGILQFFTEELSRDWALQDDEVLRQLRVSMEEVRGAKFGLAPLARRDEFPRKILGLDLVSSGPGPRLASRSMETHPRDVGLALSGPPAQDQWLSEAKAQRQEGPCAEHTAVGLSLGARENQGVAGLSPVQDRPAVIWKLLQWSSLPNLPSDVDFGAPWFPNVSFQQECWVRSTCPSAVASPRAPVQDRPAVIWKLLQWSSLPNLPSDVDFGAPWFPNVSFQQECWVRSTCPSAVASPRAPVQDRPAVIWKLLQWSSLPNLPSDVDFGAPWFPNVSFQQECWVRSTCPSAVASPRAPVQDRPAVIWKLLQWSSLPNLPSDVDFGAPWFPNVSFQQECWVCATCPSAVATPRATEQAQSFTPMVAPFPGPVLHTEGSLNA